jgi:hypothetical protein
LEGNYNLKDGARKASYRALWEVLLVFEFILTHFKKLEMQAKAGAFDSHLSIQNSITFA